MGIAPELNLKLEKDMDDLHKDKFLKSGRSYNNFTDDFSGLLAQTEEDKDILITTGFDYTKMEEYKAILEKMVTIYGERVAAEGSIDDSVKEYREEMPKAKEYKKLLSAVIRFILARTESSDVKKTYDMIRKGNSQVDILNDNIAMVNVIKNYPELYPQIKPAGQNIDEPFLNDVHQHALNLVALKGKSDTVINDSTENVDRLNRIISLAVAAEREIKLFAEIAFYNDIERYNRDYASSALRALHQARKTKQDDNIIIAN